MNFKKSIFTITTIMLFILLFSQITIATSTVNELNLYIDEEPLTYINPEYILVSTLKVNIQTTEPIKSITGNLSNINIHPAKIEEYSNIDIFSTCEEKLSNTTIDNNGTNETTFSLEGYECNYPNLQVKLDNLSTNISININYENTSIESEQTNKTLSFKLDNTSPEVISLGTEFCENNTCYISNLPTDILIEMQDSIGSFYAKKVFFRIGNEQSTRFTNCSNNQCVRKAYTSTCNDDNRLDLSLSYFDGFPSSDDAGNKFLNDGKTKVICDSQPPSIDVNKISYTYQSDNNIYADMDVPLKRGDVITFTINVTDTVSTINAYASFKEINDDNKSIEGTCEKTSFGGTCTWYVQALNSGDHFIYFNATDLVGHTSETAEYRIHIDEYQDNETIETPKFFNSVTTTSLAKNGYNRVVIGLMRDNSLDYPLYQTFEMSKLLSDKVEVIAYETINPAYCQLDYLNGTVLNQASDFSIDIADRFLNWDEQNRVDLRFVFKQPNAFPDNFEIICNVSAYVRVNENIYYKKPTKFQMVIPVTLKNSDLSAKTPGEKLAEKIQNKENDLGDFWNIIDEADKWMGALTEICNLHTMWTDVNAMSTEMEILGATLKGSGGEVIQFNAEKTKKAVQLPLNDAFGAGKWVRKACQWSKCNVDQNFEDNADENEKSSNFWTSDSSTGLADYYEKDGDSFTNDLFKNIERPNVKDSIISAAYMKCFPALLYHVNKYRQVECHELLCYKENAKMGLTVTPCEEAKSQYICQSLVGEMFEIPGIRGAKNLMDNANAMVQSFIPKSLDYVLKNTFCKKYVGANSDFVMGDKETGTMDIVGIVACHIPESIGRLIETSYRTTQGSGDFVYPAQDDICSLATCTKADVNECVDDKPAWLQGVSSFNMFNYATIDVKTTVKKPTVGELTTLFEGAKKTAGKAERDQLVKYGYNKDILDGDDPSVVGPYLTTQKLALETAAKANGLKKNDEVRVDPETGYVTYHYKSSTQYNDAQNTLNKYEKDGKFNWETSKLAKSGIKEELNDYASNKQEIDTKTFPNYEALAQTDKDLIATYNKELIEYKTATNNRDNALNAYTLEIEKRIETIQGTGEPEKYKAELRELQNIKEQYDQKIDSQNKIKELDKQSQTNNCDTSNRPLTENCDKIFKDLEKEQEKLKKSDTLLKGRVAEKAKTDKKQNEKRETLKSINQFTDKALGFMYKQGWLNWAQLSEFGHHTFVGQIADLSNTYLSSDNMKDSICSPLYDFDSDSGTMEGSAVQCMEGLCRPVLTMASEKLKINDSVYLYTLSYYLGNVRRPAGISEDEVMYYSVHLKKSGSSKAWFNTTWLKLEYGEQNNIEYAITRPINDGSYTDVCIKFKQPFPPLEATSQDEYCRKIKDSTQGSMDFDTGSFNPKYSPETGKTTTTSNSQYALSDI